MIIRPVFNSCLRAIAFLEATCFVQANNCTGFAEVNNGIMNSDTCPLPLACLSDNNYWPNIEDRDCSHNHTAYLGPLGYVL